jgi:hypothetical protein
VEGAFRIGIAMTRELIYCVRVLVFQPEDADFI